MKSSILVSMLASQTVVGAEAAGPIEQGFRAAHVKHDGELRVDAPPGQDGREKGAVFVTTHGGEKTIWVVVDFDPGSLHVRYARISPESRAGTVQVRLRADGRGGSLAEVAYELTALNEAGNRELANFGPRHFALMMQEWEDAIRAADIDYRSLIGE